jgi:hypothetical protein
LRSGEIGGLQKVAYSSHHGTLASGVHHAQRPSQILSRQEAGAKARK